MIESVGLDNVLPTINTVDEGVNVYLRDHNNSSHTNTNTNTGFFTKEDELKYGVVAIEMKKV